MAFLSVSMEKISKAQIKLVRSLQQKKYRDETGLFVAEGEKCVEELRKGFALVHLYREGENATRTEIEQMSGLKNPQGIIGVFRKREMLNDNTVTHEFTDSLTLVLDGIQDPGNLGTIIRTCDWFGVRSVLCSQETADCYNPKVVQATMGALARVRLYYLDLPAWFRLLTTNKQAPATTIYGTLLEGKDMYHLLEGEAKTCKKQNSQTIIIMGNEGNGISQAVRPFITHPIRIPSYPADAETSESLNVAIATAIVLAEFRRRE